jgi:hypothetical protein
MVVDILTYAGSFSVYMEQRAVIHFFTPKEMKAKTIQTGVESVHGPESLA